jgi:hypothetical protein
MRRLPRRRILRALVERRSPQLGTEIDRVAERLARFHGTAQRGPDVDRHGSPRGHRRADDVFRLDDGPRLLDCLEFDDALRHVDTVSDLASLALELERLGGAGLAERLTEAYKEASGDAWPDSLSEFYLAHRALVRSKVACLRAASGNAAAPGEARQLAHLGVRHLRRGRVRLVLVGGLPGTGKSTLARNLGAVTGWTVLRSDALRAECFGPRPGGPDAFGQGRYEPERVAEVYAELLDRAGPLLRVGQSVVLDAPWRRADWRRAARQLAERAGAASWGGRTFGPGP